MGFYIPGPGKGKADFLEKEYQATKLPFDPDGLRALVGQNTKAVVCVVDNRIFDAAALAFNSEELEVFLREDGRPKQWLVMDKELAYELAGFKAEYLDELSKGSR